MSNREQQIDNCAGCGAELASEPPPRTPCSICGETARIVHGGPVTLLGTSSLTAETQVITGAGGIESEEAFGTPSIERREAAVDYKSDLWMFQVEQLTRGAFVGICDSDVHEPFACAGRNREEVVHALCDHAKRDH